MGITAIGKTLITLRAVLPQDKTLALAFEVMIVGLFAYVPAHLSYELVTREYPDTSIDFSKCIHLSSLCDRHHLRLLGTQLRALSAPRDAQARQHSGHPDG